MIATRKEAATQLSKLKQCIAFGHCTFADNRPKNQNCLAELRITPLERRKAIECLSPENYISGPEQENQNPAHDVWVFGLLIEGSSIYLKFKVFSDENLIQRAYVMSFHEADYPLHFPFKGGKNE